MVNSLSYGGKALSRMAVTYMEDLSLSGMKKPGEIYLAMTGKIPSCPP